MVSDSLAQAVQASSLIVIARVTDATPARSALLQPEAFLKGSASNAGIPLEYPLDSSPCPLATLRPSSRVLVFLASQGGQPGWPGTSQVVDLDNATAVQQEDGGFGPSTEAAWVSRVRSVTGQYAVPSRGGDGGGASIDWNKTILPVGAAIAGLLVVGLALMRVWHRIDPS